MNFPTIMSIEIKLSTEQYFPVSVVLSEVYWTDW